VLGRYTFGTLGDGTTTNRLTPVAVQGVSDAIAVDAGIHHSCALLRSGQVVCWGLNIHGELGDATTIDALTPVAVQDLSDATRISAGGGDSCALRQSGSVVCWGWNLNGQLGDGTRIERSTPVAVQGLGDATAINAGWGHSCALRQSGQAACWGQNDPYGKLGDGTQIDRLTPVAVQGLSDAIAISAANLHSCALRQAGQVVCWGHSSVGQIGDGTAGRGGEDGPAVYRLTPVAVIGFP
jgi:alpha-tubulin suppressor-like RCC1 family protein